MGVVVERVVIGQCSVETCLIVLDVNIQAKSNTYEQLVYKYRWGVGRG